MLTSSWLIRLILVALLGLATPAVAQTMYRCGSTYQDQPCSAAQSSGSVVGGSARAPVPKDAGSSPGSVTLVTPVSDPSCRQRGLAAERIRWSKEGGRTLQQAEDADVANSAFLRNVYGRPGTAAEVRVAVEADCNDEQQRALEAARLNAAAAAITAGGGSARPSSSSGALSSANGSPHH
jgi:hypothetical protein